VTDTWVNRDPAQDRPRPALGRIVVDEEGSAGSIAALRWPSERGATTSYLRTGAHRLFPQRAGQSPVPRRAREGRRAGPPSGPAPQAAGVPCGSATVPGAVSISSGPSA
jgi:hypothetical protein